MRKAFVQTVIIESISDEAVLIAQNLTASMKRDLRMVSPSYNGKYTNSNGKQQTR